MPPREKLSPWTALAPVPFHRASVDVEELVGALEEEFDRALPPPAQPWAPSVPCWW